MWLDAPSFTVGLVFLTDLLFLLRLPNFWELLSQPVSTFLEELYGGVGEHDLSREFLNNSATLGQPGVVQGTVNEGDIMVSGAVGPNSDMVIGQVPIGG